MFMQVELQKQDMRIVYHSLFHINFMSTIHILKFTYYVTVNKYMCEVSVVVVVRQLSKI